MSSPAVPPFDKTRFDVLSNEIKTMALDVNQKFKMIPEQLSFRHVREKLDQLMVGVPPIHGKAVQELSLQLERLAARVQQATGSFLNEAYIKDESSPPVLVGRSQFTMEDVYIPLCSSPRPPSQIPVAEGPVKEGMKKLDTVCDCIQIKGDGDCLFRAFATGLLCHYLGKQEELANALQTWQRGLGKKISDEVWTKAEPTVKALSQCHSPEDVTIIMNDEKLSNSLTKLMRHLAVAGLQAKCDTSPAYLGVITADRPEYAEDSEQYFEDMRNPPDAYRYGGQAEYVSLGEIFFVQVPTPQDVQLIGSGTTKPTPLVPDAINLLFNPGHYNLAIPKKIAIGG